MTQAQGIDVECGGRTRRVAVTGSAVLIDGRSLHLNVVSRGATSSVIVGPADQAGGAGSHGSSYEVSVIETTPGELLVAVNGRPVQVRVPARGRRPTQAGSRSDGAGTGPRRVVAPMPGRVAKVLVKVGDVVAARQGLVVIEAMKMENELRAPGAGTVVEVRAVPGAPVDANAVLVVLE